MLLEQAGRMTRYPSLHSASSICTGVVAACDAPLNRVGAAGRGAQHARDASAETATTTVEYCKTSEARHPEGNTLCAMGQRYSGSAAPEHMRWQELSPWAEHLWRRILPGWATDAR